MFVQHILSFSSRRRLMMKKKSLSIEQSVMSHDEKSSFHAGNCSPGNDYDRICEQTGIKSAKKKVLQVYDLFLSRNSDGLLFTLKAAC